MTKEEFIKKYNIYTGKKLEKFIKMSLYGIKYRRLIIRDIINDFNSENNRKRLISITGDRRRGKSTTMLQIIQILLRNNNINSEDIIFINGKSNNDLFEICNDLMNLIIYDEFNPKFIFIDEITDMNNLDIGIKSLSDEIKYYGNNIVVTGTWSQIFHELKLDILLDRVIVYELEQITFNDNKKFLNRDVYESIDNGLYIQDIKRDITFQDSIDNMTNFLRLSTRYKDYDDVITDNDIKLFYFSFLYLGKQPNSKNIKNYSTLSDKYNYLKEIENNIQKVFYRGGEDLYNKLNKDKIEKLIKILLLTKQILFRSNIASKIELNKSIIDRFEIIPKNITVRAFLNKNNKEVDESKLYQSIFEDYISTKIFQDEISIKIRNNENEEIDVIDIENEMLIEVKFTEKKHNNFGKHLLNNALLKEFNLEEFSKNIVYLGDSKNLNNGIKLWNIYDFEREVLKEEHLLEFDTSYNKINRNFINLDWD